MLTLFRFLLTGCLIMLLFSSGCVSSKKYRLALAETNSVAAARDSIIGVRNDTIQDLTIRLAEARGGNELLLRAQSILQDRLIAQDDEMENVAGNMNSQLRDLRRQLADTESARDVAIGNLDSIRTLQAGIIEDFEARVNDVSDYLVDSLEFRLTTGDYFISNRSGEVTLSIQEEVLFRRNSTSNLNDDATATVLRVVTDVLQKDPLLKLVIVGHTDNQTSTRRSTDNWEYAALRAATLADVLASEYYVSPNRLMAASQGEYAPARSNASPDGQRANRRIDFVFTNNVANLTRQLGKLTTTKK